MSIKPFVACEMVVLALSKMLIRDTPLVWLLPFRTCVRFRLGHIEFTVVLKVSCGLSKLVLRSLPSMVLIFLVLTLWFSINLFVVQTCASLLCLMIRLNLLIS